MLTSEESDWIGDRGSGGEDEFKDQPRLIKIIIAENIIFQLNIDQFQ